MLLAYLLDQRNDIQWYTYLHHNDCGNRNWSNQQEIPLHISPFKKIFISINVKVICAGWRRRQDSNLHRVAPERFSRPRQYQLCLLLHKSGTCWCPQTLGFKCLVLGCNVSTFFHPVLSGFPRWSIQLIRPIALSMVILLEVLPQLADVAGFEPADPVLQGRLLSRKLD